jgi:hypothetical protein
LADVEIQQATIILSTFSDTLKEREDLFLARSGGIIALDINFSRESILPRSSVNLGFLTELQL